MNLNQKLITKNLFRSRSHSLLNIIGLSIGFACSFAVIIWIKNELSYDKFLPEAGRIYRLTFETTRSGNTLHFARCWEKWVSQMPAAFPQIEELVRLEPYRHTALKAGENKFYSERVFATDSNFFSVFGVGMVIGDKESALSKPNSAVISLSMAQKCFGKTEPVGQILLMSGEYDTKMNPFTITGVMNDSPINSHIHFDVVTSFANPNEAPSWAYVYLLLKKGSSPDDILKSLPDFIKEAEKTYVQTEFKPHLQKITDIHLYSNKDREFEQNGNITGLYLFGAIALVLLLVSWVNYYNLSKTQLLYLKKQIHIQRILGSAKWQIISRSASESAISNILALILAFIMLDSFNQIGGSLTGLPHFPDIINSLAGVWPYVIVVFLILVIAGSIPVGIFLTGGRKSLIASDELPDRNAHGFFSYGILITFQICLSVILLVAALTIYQQKKLLLSSGLGKMSSDILAIKKLNWEVRYKYKSFREKALQDPLIKNITASIEEPSGETVDAMQVESTAIDDIHEDNPLYVLSVEDNFLDFFGLSLIAGRNFSPYNPDRKGEDYILNETAVKKLGWTNDEAIGRPFKIKFDTPDIFYGGTVVGVVKDFHFNTLKQEIKPYVLFQKPIFYLCFLIQVDSARKTEALASLRKIWDQELPDYPFQFEYISDLYNSAYKKELAQNKLTSFFSILATVIICLGLFSVTSVLVSRRTKEIGIRKINGAKLSEILLMLNSGFLKCFIIAFIIACPVAWYTMHKWLQNFVYHTELKWWMFAVSGLLVLTVTLLTVSLQSLKAAMKNPVEALRYE
jgi:putative ABC transport system permease protein